MSLYCSIITLLAERCKKKQIVRPEPKYCVGEVFLDVWREPAGIYYRELCAPGPWHVQYLTTVVECYLAHKKDKEYRYRLLQSDGRQRIATTTSFEDYVSCPWDTHRDRRAIKLSGDVDFLTTKLYELNGVIFEKD